MNFTPQQQSKRPQPLQQPVCNYCMTQNESNSRLLELGNEDNSHFHWNQSCGNRAQWGTGVCCPRTLNDYLYTLMTHWLQTNLAGLENFGIWAGVLFVFLFAGLSMLGLPLIPFALAGGALFGMAGGMAGIVIGSSLGATGGFLCSRYLARQRFARLLEKNRKFFLIDDAIRREGWKIVGLLRMCPLPFGLSNYAYGLTGISFPHYLAATIVGMLPGETVFVYLGTAGRRMVSSQEAMNNSPAVQALTYLGIIAAVLVLVMIRKIVSKRLALAED